MSGLFEWIIFLALSLIAVVTAAGMILTMSMYRAGLALMASFVALAGLFILLNADLLAAIQVMMNVGGMLVMVLFMVMMMMDPGGEMMWGMKRDMHISGPAAFSMTMPRGKPPEEEGSDDDKEPQDSSNAADWTCPMHPEVSQQGPGTCPKCGMALIPRAEMANSGASMHTMTMGESESEHEGHDMQMSSHDSMSHHSGMTPRQYYEMMVGMAMSTTQLPWAIVLGAFAALLLIILVIQTPWPLAATGPTQDATTMVGELLLSRYMIGFEGAAFLILAGIAGAVILGKREGRPPELTVQPAQKPAEAGDKETEQQTYTCPMHPEIRQKQPGTCPKCGMTLIPAKEAPVQGDMSKQGEHS